MHGYRRDIFSIVLRIMVLIVLVVVAMIGPVWLALGLAAVLAFLFKSFVELIVVGIVCDLLYAPGLSKELVVFSALYTVFAVAAYGSIAFLKKRLSWYN